MVSAAAPRSNKLRVGYRPRRVFEGRGCAQLGGIVPGVDCLAGRRASILADGMFPLGLVGGASALPATYQGNQALSALGLGVVAWPPSHGRMEIAGFRAFRQGRCLIASYRTRPQARPEVAGSARLGTDRAGGGRPPRAGRADPTSRRAGATGKLRKSAFGLPSAGAGTAGPDGRNISSIGTGSGVLTRCESGLSARENGAERVFQGVRVGVMGEHCSLDLGRNGEADGGGG